MRREALALGAVVALGLALMLLGIDWGLPNVVSWNGDDLSPEKPLRVVNDWLRRHHKYPYLHWWLSLVVYAPWLGWLALTGEVDLGCLPRLRSACFANPERDMTVFMTLSRLLSVAMALGAVLLTHRLALATLADRRAALVAAAVVAGSPTLVFFAHTGNLEAPLLFWFTASLVAGVAVWRRGATRDYAAFGLLAACAITTKGAILAAYALPSVALLAVHVRRVRGESGAGGARLLGLALRDRRLRSLLALLLGVYALVQNVLFNWGGFVEHWRSWTEGTPIYQAHRARAAGLERLPQRTLWSLEALLGFPALALCLAGALYCAAVRSRSSALALPLASYFGFAIVPSFVAPRLLLPLLPILAVWAGAIASRVLRAPRPASTGAAALAAGILLHQYATAFHLDLRLLGDSRYEAEAWIAEHVPEGAAFAGLAAPSMLPRVERIGHPVRWYALSEVRSGTLEADGADWALVGEDAHPHADREYLDALRRGERGYDVAYRATGSRPLPRWLDVRLPPGAVSPTVWVLRRRGADAEPRDLGPASR